MTFEQKPIDLLTTQLNKQKSIETAYTGISAQMLSLSLSINTFGLTFWISSTWDPVAGEFGALPFICEIPDDVVFNCFELTVDARLVFIVESADFCGRGRFYFGDDLCFEQLCRADAAFLCFHCEEF